MGGEPPASGPSRMSSATTSPAASPTTTRPPPIAGDVFTGLPSETCQRRSPVVAPKASRPPPPSATYTTLATTAGMFPLIGPSRDFSQAMAGCASGPGPATTPVRPGPPWNMATSETTAGRTGRREPTASNRPIMKSRPTSTASTRTRSDAPNRGWRARRTHDRRCCGVVSTVAWIDSARSNGACTCGAGVSAARIASSVSVNCRFIAVLPLVPSRAHRARSRAAI